MRDMMLTMDEYLALRRLISSERESEGAIESAASSNLSAAGSVAPKRRRSAYSRKYKAAFKKVSARFKKKNGQWKANGFRAAVRAAHKEAKR